jgi:hypothetical protein
VFASSAFAQVGEQSAEAPALEYVTFYPLPPCSAFSRRRCAHLRSLMEDAREPAFRG